MEATKVYSSISEWIKKCDCESLNTSLLPRVAFSLFQRIWIFFTLKQAFVESQYVRDTNVTYLCTIVNKSKYVTIIIISLMNASNNNFKSKYKTWS